MNVVAKIKGFFSDTLNKGLTSCELATTLTIAILSTTFPVFGITTVAVTAIGVRKKLNIPLLILVTYTLEPLRFFAFIPLNDFGSLILNNPHSGLTIEMVKQVFTMGWMSIVSFFFSQLVYAIAGWIIVIVPLSIPFFYFAKSLIGVSIPKTKECLD